MRTGSPYTAISIMKDAGTASKSTGLYCRPARAASSSMRGNSSRHCCLLTGAPGNAVSASCGFACGLVLEEMPNGIPDVFKTADCKTRGRFSAVRQRLEQGAALAVEPALRCRRYFQVTRIAGERGDIVQGGLGIGAVARGIVAVRCVEKIHVVAAGVEARAHDLADFLQPGRCDGAAAAAHLEEFLFVELPGFGGVGDENGIQITVLTAQPLHRPEKEGLGERPVAVRHAGRHVHEKEHDGLRGGLLALGQLAEPQIIVREHRRIRGLDLAALDGFAHRAPAVQARPRAAAVPTLPGPVGFLRAAGTGAQIRQFHLFPEPIDDVVDLEFEKEFEPTVVAATATLAGCGCGARLAELIAGFGRALPDALLFLGRPQPEMVVLEHADRYADG